MKRVAIWGCGRIGREIMQLVNQKENQYTLVALADANESKQNQVIEGILVIAPEDLVPLAEDRQIDMIIFAFDNHLLYKTARIFRHCKIEAYFVPYYEVKKGKIDSWDKLLEFDITKPRMEHLEFHAADQCNMKCKGCLHFSNIVEESIFYDYNQLISDIKQVKKFFSGIDRIKILGGEPLLNKEIAKYVTGIRELCPEANLEITTNGLLIPMCQNLFPVMKEADCSFSISLYKPMHNKIEEIKSLLEYHGVSYSINLSKGTFTKFLQKKPCNDDIKYYFENICIAKHCHHLRDGKLAVCSRPIVASVPNQKYDTNFPTEDGVINIYTTTLSPWEIEKKLNSPFEHCEYCGEMVEFLWERADVKTAKLADWIIDDLEE